VAVVVILRAEGVRAGLRRLRESRLQLLLLWALVPLVLFSLSRTQHHWYLDPSYPAWAMLAAGAVLALVRRTRPERRTAVLVACVLVPLALCEVRLLYRVLIAERMPEPQRFLTLLKDHRLELGPEIRTSPLRHSERFILEAMDGFWVEEVEAHRAAAAAPASLLVAKGVPGPRLQPSPGSGIFLENRHYLLFQGADQIAGRSAPRGPRRRMPIKRHPAPGTCPPPGGRATGSHRRRARTPGRGERSAWEIEVAAVTGGVLQPRRGDEM